MEDMSDLSKLLSSEDFHAIITQCVETTDFEILSVSESSLDKGSGGYLSDYVLHEIRIRLPDNSEISRNLFSKTFPVSVEHQKYVKEMQCFEKEVGFYTTLLPILLKYQTQGITDDNRVKGRWGPHCLLIRDDIIVMEDLSVLGYKVCNYRELFDWDHCAATLKKMANFHAASFVYEEKEESETWNPCRIGDMYPEFFHSVVDRTMPGDESIGWFPSGVRALTNLVPFLSKYKNDKKLQQIIQEKLPSALKALNDLARSNKYRNVVCHGDLWTLNILFRYDKDKRPETVRLIDYQILRYAPPTTDIIVFLFTTTNQKFRERHTENLLRVYYDEFSTEMLRNGLSPRTFLTFDELQESFTFFLPSGRAIAAMYYQMILMDAKKKEYIFSLADRYVKYLSVDRSSEVLECFESDEIYRCRLEESIEELIEKDILNNKQY